jgi:hypothetical protein
MMSKAEVKTLILDLFREEALILGGLVAVHEVEDDMVWKLVRNLDAIRRKTLRRLEDNDPESEGSVPPKRPNIRPHPAIEQFLLGLRKG